MASHKFAVGQTLLFSPSLGEDSRRKRAGRGRHRRPTAIIGTASANATGWRNRKFADSPLEGSGFELSVPVRQAKLTRSCR